MVKKWELSTIQVSGKYWPNVAVYFPKAIRNILKQNLFLITAQFFLKGNLCVCPQFRGICILFTPLRLLLVLLEK